MKFPNVKETFVTFKVAAKKWWDRDPFRQSAIIAYYAIFSLTALLVIVISSAGLVFGKEAVSGEISTQIAGIMGNEAAKQVEGMIAKTGPVQDSIVASVLGIITLLVGTTGVFAQLQTSLNLIWGVEPKPTAGYGKLLKDRLFSFGLIVSIGFLLLVSLVVSSALAVLSGWIKGHFPDYLLILVHILNFVVSFGVITVLFALMFKILPDAKVQWHDVWIGAIATSFLFTIGKFGLALYFGKTAPGSSYGAAGSIILILLWVSYSCMILFLGAEFTKHYSERKGKKIEPAENAQPIEAAEEFAKR